MWLITKELAEAVVKSHIDSQPTGDFCSHCQGTSYLHGGEIQHTPECIVTRAKLLLELEYGVKS